MSVLSFNVGERSKLQQIILYLSKVIVSRVVVAFYTEVKSNFLKNKICP
jgi:hypothetical protein